MPKKGIHPVMRSITYVLKNGASVELPTVLKRSLPYTLQAVRTSLFSVALAAVATPVYACNRAEQQVNC